MGASSSGRPPAACNRDHWRAFWPSAARANRGPPEDAEGVRPTTTSIHLPKRRRGSRPLRSMNDNAPTEAGAYLGEVATWSYLSVNYGDEKAPPLTNGLFLQGAWSSQS